MKSSTQNGQKEPIQRTSVQLYPKCIGLIPIHANRWNIRLLNILTDNAINTTPSHKNKPFPSIFSLYDWQWNCSEVCSKHARWRGKVTTLCRRRKRLEFSRSLLFIYSTGIELHDGMRDCPCGEFIHQEVISRQTYTLARVFSAASPANRSFRL